MKICFQIIFLSLLALSSVRAAEPVYDGKALSEWLVYLQGDLSDDEIIAATRQNMDPAKSIEQKQSLAREAIRQIGTRSVLECASPLTLCQKDEMFTRFPHELLCANDNMNCHCR